MTVLGNRVSTSNRIIAFLMALLVGAVAYAIAQSVGVSEEFSAMIGLFIPVLGAFFVQILDQQEANAKQSELEMRIEALASDIMDLREGHGGQSSESVISELKLLKTLLGQVLDKKGGGTALKAKPPQKKIAAEKPRDPVDFDDDVDDALLEMEERDTLGSDVVVDDTDASTSRERDDDIDPEMSAQAMAKPGARPIRIIKRDKELLQVIEKGLSENRVDLYLQPTVVLPSRKTVHYECYSRVRDDEGRIILPRQYMQIAQEKGLVGTIDNLLLFRLIQLVRRLGPRHAHMRFFCNLSDASIEDEEFFPQFVDYMQSAKEFSDRLVFEITQDSYFLADSVTRRQLETLGRAGFSFSLDRVKDFGESMDLHLLKNGYFRYLKTDISDFADTIEEEARVDFVKSVRDQDMFVIASRIEDEDGVLTALDSGIELAQGYHIGLPQSLEQLENDL